MSATITIDTLAFANKLKKAGVPDMQAEAHAFAIAELADEKLASKEDIIALRVELKADINVLRVETKADIKRLETDIKELELRTDINFLG